MNLLRLLHLIETCPNCYGALTGGRDRSATRFHCIVCGGTGWTWTNGWLSRRRVERNVRRLRRATN